jgi:hypothetical protein
MRHVLGVILLLVVGSANATPLVWTLNDVAFDFGSSATGSFTYDAATGIYSDISIQTTSLVNFEFTGANYGTLNNGTIDGENLIVFETGTPNYILKLDWLGNLSDAGGTVALETDVQTDLSYEINMSNLAIRVITGGSISAVPIPAAVWLFGSALAGLGWLRRRQTA